MEKLYVWLQEEVKETLELLENKEITKELPEQTIEDCKKHLIESNNALDVLIQVFKTSGFNAESLISIIAAIKGAQPNTDENRVLQKMMLKLYEMSRADKK